MGLDKKYWKKIVRILDDVIPIYNKINYYISFGNDEKYRMNGINANIKQDDMIFDAGSGFGNMSKTALSCCKNINITLFDPLLSMLKKSNEFFVNKPSAICGVFEYIPIQNERFDIALCGYSLRDALSIDKTISEIHRILKKNGKWIIVDLGKPDNRIIRIGVMCYLYAILPIIALIIGGKKGLKFREIYGTYKKWPTNKKLITLLSKKFVKIESNKNLLGGAITIIAQK